MSKKNNLIIKNNMGQAKLHLFSRKTFITLALFLIGSLHTLIFTFFQLPDNYATNIPVQYLLYVKFIPFVAAILTSFFHHYFCKVFGIKTVFITGLLCNLIGLGFILLSWVHYGNDIYMYIFILLACFSFGLALLTVINSLITYLIIEYPDWINTGVIALFIFLNLGVMLSPILLDFFNHYNLRWLFILGLMVLLGASIASGQILFSNRLTPKHPHTLPKSTSLWKDLHYRLAFFVLAIIFYGIVENTFSLWGEVYLAKFIPVQEANSLISLFWLFMIIGQILALFPLFYLSPKVVFTFFCLIAAFSLWGLYTSLDVYALIGYIILGGMGCSAIFPLILASLGNQIVQDSKSLHEKFLPYIEIGTAYILAGYIFGVGFIDFIQVWDYQETLIELPTHFYYAIWAILGTLLIYLFLDMYGKMNHKKE